MSADGISILLLSSLSSGLLGDIILLLAAYYCNDLSVRL